jgi:uncharacterized membrane protein
MTKTKTASFATMHFTIAFTVAYLLTGSLVVGGALAIIEPALNTVAYYFHEKLWQRISAASQRPPFSFAG